MPTELSLNIGETAKTSKIEVTVKSVEKTDCFEFSSDNIYEGIYMQCAPEGKTYLLVDIAVKNIGTDWLKVELNRLNAVDSFGFRYNPEGDYFGRNRLNRIQELYIDQEIEGRVIFEVPQSAKILFIQYDFGSIFTGRKLASWELE